MVWSMKKDGQGGAVGAALVTGVLSELYWRPDGQALAALDGDAGVTVWRIQ